MAEEVKEEAWRVLQRALEQKDTDALTGIIQALPPAEFARALFRLDEAQRAALLTALEPESAANLIEELPESEVADIIEDLPANQAAAIMDRVDSDSRADIFAVLNDEDREAILRQMSPEEASDARALLAYPPNTAGGLMITEYLSYNARLTVEDVLKDMRENAERYSDYAVQYVYVTSDDGRLEGVIRLRDLVMTPGSTPLSKIMIAKPYHVTVTDSLEYLEQFFNRHVFFGMPVVDNFGKLVGVVQRADVEEAHGEAAAKTFLRFGGIIGGEELRSMSVKTRTARRFLFLAPNILLNIIAASVIALYEDTLERVIALAVFLPIISDMSGNAGNQAVAVSIRELSLGLVKPKDLFRVWWKELQVGTFNAVALCFLMMLVAFLWKHDFVLAALVGVALGLNTVIGVLSGGGIPLALRFFKLDPALAASPLLTTITDMCGFFLSLSFAAVALGWGWL